MRVRALVALAFAWALVAAVPAAAQESGKTALKIGQAQDPQTLNPFIAQDEEDFRVCSINYDLLVNFSPKALGPVPGIAKSWTISPDKKTITFKLFENHKWSDGQPITSKDVKYSLETFAPNSLLFGSYVENVSKIDTPDDLTVVIHTKRPDARIVGGLFVYILPEHIWGKVPVKKLTGSYRPTPPLVGSGPYIVSEFQHGRLVRMTRNPNFTGKKPAFDEVQWIKYGNSDAVDRALTLGEIDVIPEVEQSSYARLGKTKDIKAISAPSPSFTQLAFNLCTKKICPDAKFNPAVQDVTVRQAIAYAIDRDRINKIGARGTAFPGQGLLPNFYKAFFTPPAQDYALDVDKANQMLDDAGWKKGSDGIRAKGGQKLSFDLFVRSESQENITDARLVAEMAKKIGVQFKVQVVSVDKLTEITTQKKNGKMAPDFDTFIWGWGGDPYDPSALLKLVTTNEIGGSSDSFYSNPEYDKLFQEQTAQFDQAKRKEIVQKMVALTQRDLPYLVLTYDPVLEAYRTSRLDNVTLQCPKPGGDAFCQQAWWEPLLTLAPASGDSGGGSGAGIFIAIGVVLVAGIAFVLIRRRRGGGPREPLELET